MRSPTPLADQLAWHTNAVSGFRKIVAAALDPQVGWYKRRLVHGGPFVPARIWLEQDIDPETGELAADERLRCEVNGEGRDPVEEWPRLWNNAITEAEHDYMIATRRWAAWHSPADPAANPRQKLDPLTTPIQF